VDPRHDSLVPSGELGPEQRDDLPVDEGDEDVLKLVELLAAEAAGNLAPPA
jgi:hypothetical protein